MVAEQMTECEMPHRHIDNDIRILQKAVEGLDACRQCIRYKYSSSRLSYELFKCGKIILKTTVVVRMIQFQACDDRIIEIQMEKVSFVFACFHQEAPLFYQGSGTRYKGREVLACEYIIKNCLDVIFGIRIDGITLIIESWHHGSEDTYSEIRHQSLCCMDR